MKVVIEKEKTNPFLKRKELILKIDHSGEATPTKAALQLLVSKQFGFAVTKTDIRQILTETGIARSRAKVFIWEEKEVDDLSKKVEEKKEEVKEIKEKGEKEVGEDSKKESEVPSDATEKESESEAAGKKNEDDKK